MTSCSKTNPIGLGNICNAILGIKSIQIRCQYNNNVLHTYQYTSNTFFGCKYVCSTNFLFSRSGSVSPYHHVVRNFFSCRIPKVICATMCRSCGSSAEKKVLLDCLQCHICVIILEVKNFSAQNICVEIHTTMTLSNVQVRTPLPGDFPEA